MSHISRRTFVSIAGLAPFFSHAQQGPGGYPNKPIRLIVPFPPGGGTDTAARLLGAELTVRLGQSIVIENRSGASGNIATEHVARSAPDGYTLGMVTTGQLITNPLAMKMSFSPEKEIALLARVSGAPMYVVVKSDSPYKDIKTLIERAKASKDGINYGSAGIGTPQHLGMEMFKHSAGFKATHVAYKGSSPALMDLMGGALDVIMESKAAATPHVRAGKLRVLAVTSEQPMVDMPGIPTLDSYAPGVTLIAWSGIGAPAGLPADLASHLADAIRRVITDPTFIQKMRDQGSTANWLSPSDFRDAVEVERKVTANVIRLANIKLE